jgi:undecaprenyl-phosphate galactose phosphotransferase
VGEILDGVPVVGAISEVDVLAKELQVRDFIIALSSRRQNELADIAKQIEAYAETIKVVPTLGSIFTIGVEIENMGDILALSLPRNLAKPWNIAAKRFFEFVLTLVLSILFIPLFLAIALAIKLDSRGPITFAQDRIGGGGRMFRLLKFRSMYQDADQRFQDILAQKEELREEWRKFQKIKGDDPRVTRVGRFIRKWSLDELPQLFNVLLGDMNLVGPRPYLLREKEMIGQSFRIIASVKPGITGLWQIRGRNVLTFGERLLLDEHYIRNWSLWEDIVILIKTVRVLAGREGAF